MAPNTLSRLGSQLSRGEVVLFTGAGFSLDARNRLGERVPSVQRLRELLRDFCQIEDEDSDLGELFELAKTRDSTALVGLLEKHLSIDGETLPEYYRQFFSYPWYRIYTLNVDDLEQAVSRRFHLDRHLEDVTTKVPETRSSNNSESLEVVHLNGRVQDGLDGMTFSELQYARKMVKKDAAYARCAADITTRPTVFVGTVVKEVPLWQHLEMRARTTDGGRDLRPTSILVVPKLSEARQKILAHLRVEWIKSTAEEFAENYLSKLASEANQGSLYIQKQAKMAGRSTIPFVTELASQRPRLATEYLMGSEPHWSDILESRAVERSDDKLLHRLAVQTLRSDDQRALAITGTAGTGKSTALMRLGLKLAAEGLPVLWVDKGSDAAVSTIRSKVWETEGPVVLAIDDADLFGRQLVGLISDLVPSRSNLLFVFAIRSGKLDDVAFALEKSGTVLLHEHSIPPLTDDDIEGLVDTLDRHNRLGRLKGESHETRCAAFAAQAGRQLLVAMIQATSSEKFEERVATELEELIGKQRFVYALICVASALRRDLYKDEIVLAVGGDDHDKTLNALDRLVARHLVTSNPPANPFRARHRVIAQVVFNRLQVEGQLRDLLEGLAFVAATKLRPGDKGRLSHLLRQVTSHNFLRQSLRRDEARGLYENLESVLSNESHYWLQRGSLEVESGDLRLARNFLDQARSLDPDSFLIETEYQYLEFRFACEEDNAVKSRNQAEAAIASLETIIGSQGERSIHPFHVLGVQGRAWVSGSGQSPEVKRRYLRRLLTSIDAGVKYHPRSVELVEVRDQIKKDLLMTAVS